jgi:uncharacterized protein YcbK (DUF882 family)
MRRANTKNGFCVPASLLHRLRGRILPKFALCLPLSALALVLSVESSGNAIANGDSRTLSLYHTHTGESLTIEYKRNGSFDRDALEKLNWLLRDWRRDEPTSMDPRLFDIVWEVQHQVGSTEPVNIVSGYRSPETNAMLRRRSKAVAKNSQHMLGKAMDFYLTDATITQIREVGMRMQRGGVGYYPTAFTPFVHLDAGSVRHWPRMSHDELARLFPDGKTVHIPSDGRPLERYAEAEQEILANGGTVLGTSYADAGESTTSEPKQKSFWAALFGGGQSEDEDTEVVTQKPAARAAFAKRVADAEVLASASDGSDADAPPEKAKFTLPKQPDLPVMPPLTSFRMARLAPGIPLPMVRPGTAQPVMAMANGQPQLIWQTGAQPIGGSAIPLPPTRTVVASAAASTAVISPSVPVPLPPVRITTAKVGTGHPTPAPAAPSDPDTTASIGPKRAALAPTKPVAPTVALAYAETAPAADLTPAKPLSDAAIEASRLPPTSSGSSFTTASDVAPASGQFSKKMAALCAAGKSGQPCIPSASR